MRHQSACLAASALLWLVAAPVAWSFPRLGADTQPQLIITLTDDPPGTCSNTGDDCTVTLTRTGQPSYDLQGDAYIGVVNNAPVAISFLDLGGPGVFDFKPGQGIDSYGATPNGQDTTGYGGPNTYFDVPAGPGAAFGLGLARFITPLGTGDETWFSVAALPTRIENGVPEPAAWALVLTGLGAVGAGLRVRRRGPAAA